MGIIVVLFLVCLLTILGCVWLASSYMKSQQKQQIRSMLRTAQEIPAQRLSANLLKPADSDGGLAKFLRRFAFMERLDRSIEQAGQNSSGIRLLTTCLVLGLLGSIVGSRFNFLGSSQPTALCLGVILAVIPFMNMLRKRAKNFSAFEEQLPEALDFVSRSMRAGHGFTIAVEMLAADSPDPLGAAFRRISNDIQLGSPLPVAMGRLVTQFPLVDVRFFVSSVLLQQETGGNLGEILQKLSTIIRERFRLKGQVKAASAHGRITGLVLILMPVAAAGFMLATSPQYLLDMAADKTGRMMIYGAICGQIVGYFVIKKIIKIKV